MGEIYRGYSIMPGPNDPGVIIRLNDAVVGSAASYALAYPWIDQQIEMSPMQKIRQIGQQS
jgi:hypothetical protein